MADPAPAQPADPKPQPHLVPPFKIPASKPQVIWMVVLTVGLAGVIAFAVHLHGRLPGPPKPPVPPTPAPPVPPKPPAPPTPTPDPAPVARVNGLYFPIAGPAKGSPATPLGFIRVSAEQSTSTKPIRWKTHGPAPLPLTVISPDGGLGSSIAEAYPTVPGTYRIHGIARGTTKGEADADIDSYEVEVAGPPPTPDPPKPPVPPIPPPTPPGPPKPPVPPPAPAPIPAPGLRVLIVYESSEESKYKADQVNTIYGQDFRDYCAANCAKNAKGQPELRIYDKDVNTAGESDIWQAAMKRPHPTLPWILVSNGTTGFEGPLPETKAEIMAVVQKYTPTK